MRNQIEFIYVLLFIAFITVIIILSFVSISLSSKQNEIFIRFTSSVTLTDYFLGYINTLITQQAYTQSYIAGLNSWGKEYWAAYPEACGAPQSCQAALNYYSNLTEEGIATNIYNSIYDLEKLQYYYPYNIETNISTNYYAGVLGSCNNIEAGNYNYEYPVYVTGIYLTVYNNNSEYIYPYSANQTVSDNPAFYLYNEGVQFSQSGEFSQCSFVDCANALNNNFINTCAQNFEQFTNNPYIKCNESIETPNLCSASCPYTCIAQNTACIITLSCEDTQYNIYYNGNTVPQKININSIVYQNNDTYTAHKICDYSCTYTYNLTTGQVISSSCTLNNNQDSCNSNNNIICGSSSSKNGEGTINYNYIYSISNTCSACVLGTYCGCDQSLAQECVQSISCPATITPPTPTSCIN
ncbi:hypothetical protein MJ1_0105 [Nanobdella aerobiophila]|uniref:Transmembrane protein n=1 Tax=Nanobdella aerobiophila TaxID=2586965 RepID=A0A915WSG6_9ARCH|nr:hypothetical protein [Nanobdella aerobiophila]BBL45280.1 hypothetical protein MJ1_0105 [Nanobdella aerobiophila]